MAISKKKYPFQLWYLVTAPFMLSRATIAQVVPVTVSFPNGATVEGLSTGEGVDSFLGIQYGLVGERFSRSSLLNPPDDKLFNASLFGPNCYQGYSGLPDFLHQPREQSEECLYLNIWRPVLLDEGNHMQPLPVVVWIHGGGFMFGSGADQVHNGAMLAQIQGVIVVSLNYRLGALGYLPQDDKGTGALNGLWDQIVALKWIQKHITSFGGDPDSVTIFGESAGSESVCMLSVSPLTKGLFHRAIMQSGECSYNNWMGGVPNENMEFALKAVQSLIDALGVASIEELKNSSIVSASDIQINMVGITGPSVIAIDEEILPRHPRELYQDPTNIVPRDLLVGSNSAEDTTFMGVSPEEFLSISQSALNESVDNLVRNHYGSDVRDEILAAYDPEKQYQNDTVLAYAQFHGDFYIRCPTRAFAARVAPLVAGNVFLYNFAHFSMTDPINHFGIAESVDTNSWASHLAELPFVFGTLDFWKPPQFANTTIPEEDWALSQEIMTRWANFAKTGNPNVSDDSNAATWEPVNLESAPLAETTSSLRVSTSNSVEQVSALPVLVFEAGVSRMETLPKKAGQCSAFPFTPSFLGGEDGSLLDNVVENEQEHSDDNNTENDVGNNASSSTRSVACHGWMLLSASILFGTFSLATTPFAF